MNCGRTEHRGQLKMAEANGKSNFDDDLGCSLNATIKTAQIPIANEPLETKIIVEAGSPKHIDSIAKPARSNKFGQTLFNRFKTITTKLFAARKITHTTGSDKASQNSPEPKPAQQPPKDVEPAEVPSTRSSQLSLTEPDSASEASNATSLVDIAGEVVDEVLSCELGAAAAETDNFSHTLIRADRLLGANRIERKLLSGHVVKVNHANPVPKRFHCSTDVRDPFCDPAKPIQISYEDVAAAAVALNRDLVTTSCTRCIAAENYGFDLYFKKELELYTGSFNDRGACYALVSLSEEQKKRGVISASWGDQAQGLSYNGWKFNVPITVVMPRSTPMRKAQNCRSFNARVILDGNDLIEATAIAMRVGNREGLVYINGYDHPHVIAGQGTMALEILEQVPNPDAVVVPVGGGSMISGVSAVFQKLSPSTRIIGVESEMCPSFTHAILKNGPVFTPANHSLADVLAVPKVGYNAFVTAVPCIDRMVVIDEEWIALAILRLVEEEKCVVDGAGATPMAALLAGYLDDFLGKRVVLVLSGGNIDTLDIGHVLERGLINEGRLVKFDVQVGDEHSGIKQLCELLKKIGVAIRDINHEHIWLKDSRTVKLKVVCETFHWPHCIALKEALEKEYSNVEFSQKPLTLHSKTSE